MHSYSMLQSFMLSGDVARLSSPSEQEANISSVCPQVLSLPYFLSFCSIFLKFLSQFGRLCKQFTHTGRPWLGHCMLCFYFQMKPFNRKDRMTAWEWLILVESLTPSCHIFYNKSTCPTTFLVWILSFAGLVFRFCCCCCCFCFCLCF